MCTVTVGVNKRDECSALENVWFLYPEKTWSVYLLFSWNVIIQIGYKESCLYKPLSTITPFLSSLLLFILNSSLSGLDSIHNQYVTVCCHNASFC